MQHFCDDSCTIESSERLATATVADYWKQSYETSVSVKVKVKVSLEQAMKAQSGSIGIALLFL